ncbi:MAG: helix-turn-helix transcriptional regulator, partial [Spirochaetia bacterium]
IMITVELLVGVLPIVVGLRALSLSGATASRPWRAYLRGFGVALLLLIPANLLDFGVSVALRAAGETARDGFVFAAGYGIANVVLIVAIVSGFRQSASGEALAVPQQLVDAFGITRREREVVEKLLEGKSDRQIAEELYISPRTVDTHLRSVFRKCGVTSRMQLTRLASTYGEFRNSR